MNPNKELSLGVLNNVTINNTLVTSIMNSSPKKVISFKIEENSIILEQQEPKEIEEHVFEQRDNILKKISDHLSKNNINLLFANRDMSKNNLAKKNINKIIDNINCSLILTN